MEAVQVSGRFVNEYKQPLVGKISFMPSRLYQDEVGVWYATLAPEVELTNGTFDVLVTRTDQHEHPWHYKVRCPGNIGTWSIRVEGEGPYYLKDLLPTKFRA
jgi:hypothetical protein